MWSFVSLAWAEPGVSVAAVDGANLQRPVWSIDGRLLSFEANFHEQRRIETWLGEPREGGFTRVVPKARPTSKLAEGFGTTRPAGGQVVQELAFTAALPGAYAYSSTNDAGDYDLYLSVGAAVAVAPGADGNPVWSNDGYQLVFTSARSGEGDLYRLDARSIDQPPQRLTTIPNSSEVYPDFSADGRSLVFVAHSKAGDQVWWLPQLDAAPEQVAVTEGNQIRPRCSSKGEIAFYANPEKPERWDLYVAVPGSPARRLYRGVHPDVRGPSFTADGRHILFVADDDDAFDPIRAVAVADPARVATLPLGTVGHGDLAVTEQNGVRRVAYVAKGRVKDPVRDFDRLFVAVLPALP